LFWLRGAHVDLKQLEALVIFILFNNYLASFLVATQLPTLLTLFLQIGQDLLLIAGYATEVMFAALG